MLGIFCAFFVGVAKTGVPGLGILVIPVMVLTVGDARQAAGWLLPILLMGDVFAVLFWRRHSNWSRLYSLAPWVLAGIVLGAFALALPESYLRPMVGVIVLVMLALFVRRLLRPDTIPVSDHAAPYGVTAGFATTVANAAGPVMNLYLLSKRFGKEEFIGTGAWFFLTVNLTKVPVYIYHGLFTRQSLSFDLALAAPVAVGAIAGRWIFNYIPQSLFDTLIIVLTVIASLLLFR